MAHQVKTMGREEPSLEEFPKAEVVKISPSLEKLKNSAQFHEFISKHERGEVLSDLDADPTEVNAIIEAFEKKNKTIELVKRFLTDEAKRELSVAGIKFESSDLKGIEDAIEKMAKEEGGIEKLNDIFDTITQYQTFSKEIPKKEKKLLGALGKFGGNEGLDSRITLLESFENAPKGGKFRQYLVEKSDRFRTEEQLSAYEAIQKVIPISIDEVGETLERYKNFKDELEVMSATKAQMENHKREVLETYGLSAILFEKKKEKVKDLLAKKFAPETPKNPGDPAPRADFIGGKEVMDKIKTVNSDYEEMVSQILTELGGDESTVEEGIGAQVENDMNSILQDIRDKEVSAGALDTRLKQIKGVIKNSEVAKQKMVEILRNQYNEYTYTNKFEKRFLVHNLISALEK